MADHHPLGRAGGAGGEGEDGGVGGGIEGWGGDCGGGGEEGVKGQVAAQGFAICWSVLLLPLCEVGPWAVIFLPWYGFLHRLKDT